MLGAGAILKLRAPRCPRCRQGMTVLDAAALEARLLLSRPIEEWIDGVEHRTWVCSGCGEMTSRRALFRHRGHRELATGS